MFVEMDILWKYLQGLYKYYQIINITWIKKKKMEF